LIWVFGCAFVRVPEGLNIQPVFNDTFSVGCCPELYSSTDKEFRDVRAIGGREFYLYSPKIIVPVR